MRRPGLRTIRGAGGVHRFMGWDGPILSDSGGFQVYSLIRQNPEYGVIRSNDVVFRDPDTGERTRLTPERVIQAQLTLGSDVVVCLDDCTGIDADRDEQARAVERTVRWARASREAFDRLTDGVAAASDAGGARAAHDAATGATRPLLFAVVQGGDDEALRRECAAALAEIGFDGYGFGGWPLDESRALLTDPLHWVAEALPPDAPKHALGIGRPDYLVAAWTLGYTLFDSALPTRDARHGRLYTWRAGFPDGPRPPRPGDAFFGTVHILDARQRSVTGPIDERCDCPTCRRYSRAYLHHLFRVGDASAERLATLHNLRFYARLIDTLRRAGSTAAPELARASN
jgi:queuine tRNA-ribosyltransferase